MLFQKVLMIPEPETYNWTWEGAVPKIMPFWWKLTETCLLSLSCHKSPISWKQPWSGPETASNWFWNNANQQPKSVPQIGLLKQSVKAHNNQKMAWNSPKTAPESLPSSLKIALKQPKWQQKKTAWNNPTIAWNSLKMTWNGPPKILYDPETDWKEQNGPNRLPNDSETAQNNSSTAQNS